MIKKLQAIHILMYGKKERIFFDKYIEIGVPITFYDPPDTHKVVFVTKEDISMSKKKAYQFFGTLGDIIDLIKSLPPAPTQAFLQDWKEFIIKSVKKLDYREFYHEKTKLRVRFDKAREGAKGFEGMDHWHIYNPFTKGKIDTYLDKNGNPVKNDSDPSHIIPEKKEDE